MSDARRALPSITALLEAAEIQPLLARAPRGTVTDAIRIAVDRVRTGMVPSPASNKGWSAIVIAELEALDALSLVPVLNATGVILHTNLGRAPLALAAIDAIAATAGGASNLEYDLGTGSRGSRYVHCVSLLTALTAFQGGAVLVLGAVRPAAAVTLGVLGTMAFVNGWRSMIASALGMEAAPEDKIAVMSIRAAANQFGYLLGAAAGGAALALAGFTGLGIALAGMFATAALIHGGALVPSPLRVAPEPAA